MAASFAPLKALAWSPKQRICAQLSRRIQTERCRVGQLDLPGSAVRREWAGRSVAETSRSKARKPGGALFAERAPQIAFAPPSNPRAQLAAVRRRRPLVAAPCCGDQVRPRHDADKTFAFERQNVATKRGAVHHELVGQHIDRHRPQPLQPGEKSRTGSCAGPLAQVLIVKLRDVPRSLADGQAECNLQAGGGMSVGVTCFSCLTLEACTHQICVYTPNVKVEVGSQYSPFQQGANKDFPMGWAPWARRPKARRCHLVHRRRPRHRPRSRGDRVTAGR